MFGEMWERKQTKTWTCTRDIAHMIRILSQPASVREQLQLLSATLDAQLLRKLWAPLPSRGLRVLPRNALRFDWVRLKTEALAV